MQTGRFQAFSLTRIGINIVKDLAKSAHKAARKQLRHAKGTYHFCTLYTASARKGELNYTTRILYIISYLYCFAKISTFCDTLAKCPKSACLCIDVCVCVCVQWMSILEIETDTE